MTVTKFPAATVLVPEGVTLPPGCCDTESVYEESGEAPAWVIVIVAVALDTKQVLAEGLGLAPMATVKIALPDAPTWEGIAPRTHQA